MKTKKISYNLLRFLLMSGASTILGFLSFGGVYVFLPVLPFAFAAFALSVAYEGEIYWQNITGAMNKLFKPNYASLRLARAYLLANFPQLEEEDCPQFFKNYSIQYHLLLQFRHKTLNKTSLNRKKSVEKTLRDMEKSFARLLFNEGENNTLIDGNNKKKLRDWLLNHQKEEWVRRFKQEKKVFLILKALSVLSAVFMGLGTTYLLVEAFSIIPLTASIAFTTLPFLIVPMSVVAGIAYGLLTYNTMTDLATNNRVYTAYKKIIAAGLTPHNIFMAFIGVSLGCLALLLTICTAGTWFTVAKEARPLFAWLGRMPRAVMEVINPLVTAISAGAFNVQNSAETFEKLYELSWPKNVWRLAKDFFEHLKKTENGLQRINPFRLILKVTVFPLQVIFFLGHLLSIAVTGDRIPRVPVIVSILLGFLSEGFEDLHYFFGHQCGEEEEDEHEHHDHCCGHEHQSVNEHEKLKKFLHTRAMSGAGHNHDADIPTRVIKLVFTPIYILAVFWDFTTSKLDPDKQLTWANAWDKQWGYKKEVEVIVKKTAVPSLDWQIEQAIHRIERFKEKYLKGTVLGKSLADKQEIALCELQGDLSDLEKRFTQNPQSVDIQAVNNCIQSNGTRYAEIYKKHGLFAEENANPNRFLDNLPNRIQSVG